MEFSRQEYWSGLPGPSPWDLPDLGIEVGSLALQADSLPSEPPADCSFSGYHKPIQMQEDLWTPYLYKKNVKELGGGACFKMGTPTSACAYSAPQFCPSLWPPWTVAYPWDFPGKNTRMGFSRSRDPTRISHVSCIGKQIFSTEPPGKPELLHPLLWNFIMLRLKVSRGKKMQIALYFQNTMERESAWQKILHQKHKELKTEKENCLYCDRKIIFNLVVDI